MKIIHLTASYKPAYIYGGPIQSVAKLCEATTKIIDESKEKGNFDLQVLTTTANGDQELNVSPGKPVLIDGVSVTYFKRLTKDHSHFSPQLLRELKNILQAVKEKNIVHIHGWWNLVSVLSCWVVKWYNIPVVLSPRGMLTAYTQNNRNSFAKRILHYFIGKRLLQYCHIHATSDQEKDDIQKIINPKSITVIPNLVNLQASAASSKTMNFDNDPAVFRLIFLSRIEEKKGLELLFEALSLLNINWQLTVAGSGKKEYVDYLKIKASDFNISRHINWIGQVENKDKYRIIAQHDLLILTSFNENFANVVIESLSVGTPVLISDQVGLSDYVTSQKLGWVTTLNVNAIKETLLIAFSQKEKREMIKASAPEIIRKDFNDDVLANRYLELYKQLI